MTDHQLDAAFGCERCWPPSAEAAWEAGLALEGEVELIRESHFHVNIRVCKACSQRFLWVFTETIDWDVGEDPQYWTRLPLTIEEAASLRRGQPSEAQLDSVAPERPSLRHDHPKETPAVSYWATGISVGPHD